MATELDRTVRGPYNGKAGAVAHPKAAHLGLLLVLDRADNGAGASLPRPLKRDRPGSGGKTSSRRHAVGHSFPPLLKLDVKAVAGDTVPGAQPAVLLALPSPKMPTESWLSWTLPSVSTKPLATSFLGIHVQQLRKQQTPPPSCSSDQAKAVNHGARPRRVRIQDLQK